MTRHEITLRYFAWMWNMLCKRQRESYQILLSHLHRVDFTYTLPMDGNREEDGINLRYRFGYEAGYENAAVASLLDDRPCSVLEMMAALAVRCEEIMADDRYGDRTAKWFWDMINSLGLSGMYDAAYDGRYVNRVMMRFLNREYKPNGEGGLFTIPRCPRDLRDVEIWYQANWYLSSLL